VISIPGKLIFSPHGDNLSFDYFSIFKTQTWLSSQPKLMLMLTLMFESRYYRYKGEIADRNATHNHTNKSSQTHHPVVGCFWGEWFDVLPSLLDINLPLCWSEETLLMLQGSSTLASLTQHLENLKVLFYDFVVPLIDAHPQLERNIGMLENDIGPYCLDDFLWCASIVQSRAFGLGGDLGPSLIPLVGMVNQTNIIQESNAKFVYYDKDDTFQLSSQTCFNKAEEVFVNYGYDNLHLFSNYGFIIDDPAADCLQFQMKISFFNHLFEVVTVFAL